MLCADGQTVERMGTVLRHLTVGLMDQAVTVRVLGSDPRLTELSAGPLPAIIHEPLTWPFARQRFEAILEALHSRAPTVIQACSPGVFALSAAIAEEFDADLVLQIGAVDDCEAALRETRRRVEGFVVLSEALATQLRRRLPDGAARVSLAPPGIPSAERPACFSQEDGVPAILCTSPWTVEGGVEILLRAFSILKGRKADFLGFLWGSGPHESALRRVARTLGLNHCVTFVDPLGDATDAMSGADIFVRPADDAALHADSLQAMAAGLAVVSCPGSACDHFVHGETALVCSADANSIAAAIGDLLGDRDAARRLAASAQDYVRKHHPMSAMGERAAELYRRLALAHATFPIRE